MGRDTLDTLKEILLEFGMPRNQVGFILARFKKELDKQIKR